MPHTIHFLNQIYHYLSLSIWQFCPIGLLSKLPCRMHYVIKRNEGNEILTSKHCFPHFINFDARFEENIFFFLLMPNRPFGVAPCPFSLAQAHCPSQHPTKFRFENAVYFPIIIVFIKKSLTICQFFAEKRRKYNVIHDIIFRL